MGVSDDLAPSFTQKPQLRQEDDGNKLIFECQLLASPKPEISWYRSDELLKEDNRTAFKIQSITNNKFLVVLELDDVIETDAGLYKVKAKNKMGEVAASINLNFSPADEEKQKQVDGKAPTFARKPAIRQEDDGKRLIFECRIEATPVPSVVWFHNTTEVKPGARHKLTVSKDGKSYYASLEINNVTVEDAGKYRVTAKNELGESNATISLNFDSDEAPVPEDSIKPTFTERPVIRQSEDGTKITFECRCVGKPKPTVTWYHGKKIVKESNRYKITLEEDQTLYYMARLEIIGVENADKGEYRAVAKNKYGEGVAKINLNFEGGDKPKIPAGKAPRFPKKPTIRQDGDLLIMECILEAHPMPDITWFHGDTEIKDGPKMKMSRKATGKDTFNLTLEILNPTREDGGNYRCNAFNVFGESNANIALNFQGGDEENGFAPSFIEKPRIIPNEDGTLITMRCVCKAKPAAEVTWYRGTTVIKASSKIQLKSTVISEDVYELVLLLSNPTAADGGAYRCHVRNEFGESNANLNLNIEAEPEPEGEGPSFVEKPTIQSKDNGKLVIMGCKVKASPRPTIVWYHEGREIRDSSKIKTRVEVKEDIYTIILELIDPGIDDSGLYKCNIKNELGELNANLTLNIEIIPVIKERPKIIKIVKKKTVIVECKVLSKFAPSCTWFKEASAVKEDSRHTVLIEPLREGEFTVKLEISNISQQDKGSYKLVARNEKGEATSQQVEITEIPEEKGDKPYIIKHLRSLARKENEEAEFVAVLKTSDQSCRCTWYKNSTVIRDSSEVNTSFDGTNARLIIRKVSVKYVANYRVVIRNEFGEDESSADLTLVEEKKKKKEEEEEETTVIEESEEEMSIVEEKSVIEENHVDERKEEQIQKHEEETQIIQEKKSAAKKVTKKEETKVEESKQEMKIEAKKTEAQVEVKKVEAKKTEAKKSEAEVEETRKVLEKKTAKTEEEKLALLEKIEERKKKPEAEPEAKIEGIPKLKPVKPKEEETKVVDEKKETTKKVGEKKKVVKKKVVSKKEAEDEFEFEDDYERPVLEKYEKITPTPLYKKPKKDDIPKGKRGSMSENIEIEEIESEEEPSLAGPVPDKKQKPDNKEKVEEETRRPSLKKGIPKPEEPVDELSKVKLSKGPTKPGQVEPEEPQVAQVKKTAKKPEEEREYVDDYEKPDLEKYDKVSPTSTDRTKKQNGVKEDEMIVDDYEKPELEKYEKISPTPKGKRGSKEIQDEVDIMKGKIKPKDKEDEPQIPTLRKRSVPKDKDEDKKPDEKPKKKTVKKVETGTKKRSSIKEKEDEFEFEDDYERPVLEKYEKITPTPLPKTRKKDDTPQEKRPSVSEKIESIESDEETSVIESVPDKKHKIDSNEKVEDEIKHPSDKKSIPKPEELVDELSNIKLSKGPSKPGDEKLEKPQVAQVHKIIKKPDEEREYVDEYKKTDLEKHDKVSPRSTDRTKTRTDLDEDKMIVDDDEISESEYEKVTRTTKGKRDSKDVQDEVDIMKGKIKPKDKEDEPQIPTLRKRSVPKDKGEDKKPEEKPKKKTVKKDVTVTKKRPSIKEKEDEFEFEDDYERPVLEKYEKITPTPLPKTRKKDDTPQDKRPSVSESIEIEDVESEEEPSIAEPVSDKKPKSDTKEKDVDETRRPSIKKGIPKPEESVDELSKVKLSKGPTKPGQVEPEEPQVAQVKKTVKKPEEEKKYVDEYERPDLEKYDKISPTSTDRTKVRRDLEEDETIVDEDEKSELEENEKVRRPTKDKRGSKDVQDEVDITKGKIKPKDKEEEPQTPTLRKRSVPKDKDDEQKPEEKPKKKTVKKVEPGTKKRPSIKEKEVMEEEFVDDYERPVLEKYEKITPTPIQKKKKDEKKPDEEVPSESFTSRRPSAKDKPEPMDVDEEVQLSKPKAPTKPAPEDVSLTHKTPAEITPTEDEAEAKLNVKKPEIVEEKTFKKPSIKDKGKKGEDTEESVSLTKPRTKTSTTAPEDASLTHKTPAKKEPTEGTEAAALKVKKPAVVKKGVKDDKEEPLAIQGGKFEIPKLKKTVKKTTDKPKQATRSEQEIHDGYELDFVDDYERPVLEKYEKISPTPTVKEKKEKEQTTTESRRTSVQSEMKEEIKTESRRSSIIENKALKLTKETAESRKSSISSISEQQQVSSVRKGSLKTAVRESEVNELEQIKLKDDVAKGKPEEKPDEQTEHTTETPHPWRTSKPNTEETNDKSTPKRSVSLDQPRKSSFPWRRSSRGEDVEDDTETNTTQTKRTLHKTPKEPTPTRRDSKHDEETTETKPDTDKTTDKNDSIESKYPWRRRSLKKEDVIEPKSDKPTDISPSLLDNKKDTDKPISKKDNENKIDETDTYPWRRSSTTKEKPDISDRKESIPSSETSELVEVTDINKPTEPSYPWRKQIKKEVPIFITPDDDTKQNEVPFSWNVIPEIPQAEQTPELEDKFKPTLLDTRDTVPWRRAKSPQAEDKEQSKPTTLETPPSSTPTPDEVEPQSRFSSKIKNSQNFTNNMSTKFCTNF
ncbi:PREDICTED: muscle M-line assembly protein unc-89-like [Papilio polytes]|uniref:muscle M-line assembly protein unc-89-like n=1 Tax=Papilio polytes TaxID=76194 RepID=UPI000675C866|nr:PREDICTED: muscle M-line assembly protein unc-89-like [Papilio polytes]